MPIHILRMKILNIKTDSQVRVIVNRLLKLPEIIYAHIDLSNCVLYVQHKHKLEIEQIIQNSLLKMGYKSTHYKSH